MFVFTAKFSKKRLILTGALLLLMAAAAAMLLHLLRPPEIAADEPAILQENSQRVEYLRSWGWTVDSEPVETLQLMMPDPLPEEYAAYNELQLAQGFDLSQCCGKPLVRYTYRVTNYPGRRENVQVNLYLCEGLPAAGDVICSGKDGFQSGLAFPETQ